MATNVLSNEIRIFPSSKRATTSGHYGDNFVTEYNLSSIINKMLYQTGASTNSQNGFLITTNINSENPNEDNIEFNIGGYFVTAPIGAIINAINNDSSGGDTAYQDFVTFSVSDNVVNASINIVDGANSEEAYSYMGGSDGVSASETTPYGTTITLPIMRVTGSPYEFNGLYTESKLRLTNFAIDDGDI